MFGLTTTNMTKDQLIASLTIILGLSGATAYSDALWADTAFCTKKDSKTEMTCEQIKEKPEQDVYYIVDGAEIENTELFTNSHQNPDTVRWNLAHTEFILKYDVAEMPRGEFGNKKGLKKSLTHDEVLAIISGPEWVEEDI